MKKKTIECGTRFGLLTVICPAKNKFGKSRSWVVCDCGGKIKSVYNSHLTSGKTTSCGCKRIVHGLSTHPLYHIWKSIKNRCNNPRDKSYKNYGGRGIKLCERWFNFEKFISDMGPKPNGYSIDRINNNGNYSPDNCRWATRQQQIDNRRTTVFVKFNGIKMTVKEASTKSGLSFYLLMHRIKAGDSGNRLFRKVDT